MKILLLTQWFDPEPTFKGLAFAKELKRQGHNVQVLTGFPNYPGGKVYEGYRIKLFHKEEIEGISVLRVALYPSHDRSAKKRIFNYVSFGFMSSLVGVFATKKADVIYAYHPPLTVGIAAILIKLFRRTPVVYDIQDMWPDTLKSTGMLNNERILELINIVCNIVYKYVDQIVVLSPGFKSILTSRGVPEDKIEVIYNWCDEQALNNAVPFNLEYSELLKNKFNVVFAGNMGKAQALDTILDTARAVEENKDIQFVFVGSGTETETLKQRVQQENINNALFISRMPMSAVGEVLKLADVLLVHLKDDPLFRITIPSKIQAYMTIGKPLLVGVRGDAAELVEQANCGEVVMPENIDSIKTGILKIYNMSKQQRQQLGENAQNYYKSNLSLESGVSKFIEIFRKVRNDKKTF
jgi:glycosyltransferase involved in cell wall biosynthesis